MLLRHKPKIIGITASVGKTTTKNAVYTVLSEHFRISKNSISFNSDIGIPLTILGLESGWGNPIKWAWNIVVGAFRALFQTEYPDWLILEIGAEKPGDIASRMIWVKLDIAVIGRIGRTPVHVGFFDSVDQLVKDKYAILDGLKPNGTGIIFSGDENVHKAMSAIEEPFMFGVDNSDDLRGSNYRVMYSDDRPSGISFDVSYKKEKERIVLSEVLGKQHMIPFLAAFSVGVTQSISLKNMSKSVKGHEFEPGRMKILEGINGSTLIDDSYNSSPIAARAALEEISDLKLMGRKIAVLGDMTELGDLAEEVHKEISDIAKQSVDIFISVGPQFSKFPSNKNFKSPLDALDYLRGLVRDGDVVLVKGSQSMRMDHVVKALLLNLENSKNLLVRQENIWKGKYF